MADDERDVDSDETVEDPAPVEADSPDAEESEAEEPQAAEEVAATSGERPASARERRRERARQSAPGQVGATLRHYRGHAIIFLAFAAVVGFMAVSAGEVIHCPGHWHARMDFYVNDRPVNFAHPKFTLEGGQGMPVSSHMHQGSEGTWHFEPVGGRECGRFRDALSYVDIEMTDSSLVLDGAHTSLGQAGTFGVDANHALRVFHIVAEASEDNPNGSVLTGAEPWSEVAPSEILGHQLKQWERVLVLYGNYTDAEVADLQQTVGQRLVPYNDGALYGTKSMVPAVGVAIIGLVVLGGWNALSKKT
ncbi:MAG TPA: hypothetical protein VI796_06300 [Candidatus Thermoplasmatota archaeon]|nr:hypothetical protein [Candidatus Thermoplasmatota archaeon]